MISNGELKTKLRKKNNQLFVQDDTIWRCCNNSCI